MSGPSCNLRAQQRASVSQPTDSAQMLNNRSTAAQMQSISHSEAAQALSNLNLSTTATTSSTEDGALREDDQEPMLYEFTEYLEPISGSISVTQKKSKSTSTSTTSKSTKSLKSDQSNFRKSLMKDRNASGPNETVICQVTSAQLPVATRECIAGHIFPRRAKDELPILDEHGIMVLVDINDTKNGILWAETIERAYSANQVCLMTDATMNVTFVVLDKNIMGTKIVDVTAMES
jgi:hypothetical protein